MALDNSRPDMSEALKQLQARPPDELLELKQRVPGLSLKRSTAAQSPDAPFPITVRSDVSAPPAAERYDVQSFELAVRLGPGAAAAAPTQPEALAAAVTVVVASPELPERLRQRMAEELHQLWLQSGPAPGRLKLAGLWEAAQQRYTHLLTLLPEVLEAYQSEDAWGSTVRRWAVLNDQTTIQIDAGVHPAPARQQQQQQQQPTAAVPAAGAGPQPAAELPRGLQQELGFLQKRYGLQQLTPGSAPAAAAAAAAGGSAAAAADAAAAQLAALQLSPAGAGPAALAFELSLRPTDPLWDPTHPLALVGLIGMQYPAAGSLALALAPHQQPPLPALQRQVFGRLLDAEVAAAGGRPGALRQVVRSLENHGGQLWAQAEDMAAEVALRRQQAQAQQGQQQQGQPQGRQGQQGQQPQAARAARAASSSSGSELDDDGAYAGYTSSGSSNGSSGGESGSESGGDSDGGAAADEASAAGGGGGGGHSNATLPLALTLEGLNLVDCDALELLRINLQFTCTRCRTAGELSFASAAVALPSDAPAGGGRGGRGGSGTLAAAAECGTCHAPWAVEVAPKLLHERSNVLAHVRAQGCTPADLLPSMLAGQCGRCGASAAFRSVAVGRWNERACSACHTAMRFQFGTALFVPQAPPGSRRQPGEAGGPPGRRQVGSTAASAAAAAFNGLLVPGQPLPGRGTCAHYRHSYRWLRFPCCGQRFPCDLCHEEATDGHEMKWATRMVCGYCSTEQALAPACKSCGKKLATSAAAPSGRSTKFWEGGKGQRDPSKLHKNDPRRYKNSKFKTKSQKSKRVGAEAKERRERAAARD